MLPPSTTRRHGIAGTLAVAAVLGLGGAASADAATFTVTSRNDIDDGTCGAVHCSLREAIEDANTLAGRDEIVFDIPNNPSAPERRHVIPLTSDLDPITDEVEIDGYTQPASVEAVSGTPALIKIVIGADQADNGLVLQASDSVVRGLVVSNAGGQAPDGVGIRVQGDRNQLGGNYVGLDGTSNNDFGWGNAGDGVEIVGDANVVGGSGPEDANVIAANGKLNTDTDAHADGVSIDGDDNEVRGNIIGTNPETNNDQIGNRDTGVRVAGDANVLAANVISGNKAAIEIDRGAGNDVLGNLVGTDATGTSAIPNTSGVVLHASGNRVGGTDAADANTIAGTVGHAGIEVLSNDNVIEGNRVGTDVTGTAALPNLSGILVNGDRNWIGGEFEGAGNLVSGNTFSGISLAGKTLDRPERTITPEDNVVVGNHVGTDASGTGPLGNGHEGIGVVLGDDNTIGVSGEGNVVAFNGQDGVRIESGARNSAVGNSIFENGGLGINLGVDGVTQNDTLDPDTGANGLLNFPQIDSATARPGRTEITWRIESGRPNTQMRIDFYANDACDPKGYGEAQRPIHATTVTTDKLGYASAVSVIDSNKAGQQLTATATTYSSVGWPLNDLDTSELSACRVVTGLPAGR